MNNLEILLQDNQSLLGQAKDFLNQIPEEIYCDVQGVESPWYGSVGKHLRHVLEFYLLFLKQYPSINYDQRPRDEKIENDKLYAQETVKKIKEQLHKFLVREEAEPVEVYSGSYVQRQKVISSLGRELQFLTEHTIHHYAILAMHLKHHGIPIPEGFGVARSTLEYEEKKN